MNTKVELRFCIETAHWLPADVKLRLAQMRPQNVSDGGDFIVTSQQTRYQEHNIRDAVKKLQGFVDEASLPPKERVIEEYKEPE